MSDSETPRLGLRLYESGSDLYPTRVDFNNRMELIDEQVVVKRSGEQDDIPLPGELPAGTIWEQTDAPYDLWWNTGAEWLQFSRRSSIEQLIDQAVEDRIPFNTVPSSADLNNYTTPGDYAVSGNAPNNPRLSDGILEVKGSGSMVMHRLTVSSAPIRIYVRSRIGGSWGSWREIPTEAA